MTGHQSNQALLDVLSQPLTSSGLDLEDVEVSTAGRRRLVRVLVDKDGGVTLDDIAAATNRVSEVLDKTEVMGDAPYTLEVTSPGIDRPLSLPRHWQRNVGRLVTVQPHDGASFTGRILYADEATATIDIDGATRQIPYSYVTKAHVEIEFNRPKSAAGSAAEDEE